MSNRKPENKGDKVEPNKPGSKKPTIKDKIVKKRPSIIKRAVKKLAKKKFFAKSLGANNDKRWKW